MSDVVTALTAFVATSGRCLDVAIDHGFFGERHFLNGSKTLAVPSRTVVAAPDAIQLTRAGAETQAHRERAPCTGNAHRRGQRLRAPSITCSR